MYMKLTSTLRALIALLLCMLMLSTHAAPINEAGTEVMKVQFVLLGSSNSNDLMSEKWNSTSDKRAQALSEMNKLNNSSTPSSSAVPRQLLSQLSRLTDSGSYKVLYATQWSQPSTQKRNKIKIESSIQNFAPYNLVFGELQLFERSALISKIDINIVNQDNLHQNEGIVKKQTQNDIINVNQGLQAPTTTAPDELALQELETIESDNVAMTPIIYLNQQRQLRPGQILYFDHPVTPAFLLITLSQD